MQKETPSPMLWTQDNFLTQTSLLKLFLSFQIAHQVLGWFFFRSKWPSFSRFLFWGCFLFYIWRFHFKQQYTVLRSPHVWPSPLTFPWESCLPLSLDTVGVGARDIVWETWVSTDPVDTEILLEPWVSTVKRVRTKKRREESSIHEMYNRTSIEEPTL